MKKLILFASIMLATVCAQAQLRVNSNGNVLLNTTSTTGSADLTIGKASGQTGIYITTGQSCIEARRVGACYSPTMIPAIGGYTEPYSYFYNIGLKGTAYASTANNNGRAYGVWGEAGNTTSGYNYGVFGVLYGNQNGAGVYGTTQFENGVNVSGRYAGYFNGDVKVTGTLYAPVLTTTAASSSIATAQIALAEANSTTTQTVSDKLSQLSAVQYNISIPQSLVTNLSQQAAPMARNIGDSLTITDTDTVEVAYPSDIELQALEKNHYGLMAAQLQQIYPDLVYEGQNGELCINYIEMIPLLVESIKELKARLDAQEDNGGAVMMSRAAYGVTNIEESTAVTIPMLKQNNPNPFTENTAIEYALPETVQTANIYIYDMNGTQIQQIALTERGEASVTVNGGMLSAGMYLYSLIADGKVIDTKRMILTK